MTVVVSLFMLFFSYICGRLTVEMGRTFLLKADVTAINYQGKSVPTSYGGFMVAILLFLSTVSLGFARWIALFSFSVFAVVLLASVTVTFLGWLDDTIGNHYDKGFMGHFRTLAKEGRLTTGFLKAAGGGVMAAIVAVVTATGTEEWILHTLFIGLMTNWLNLLDLRPGRALKFYIVTGISLFIIGLPRGDTFFFIPLLGLAIAILRDDLSGRFMLGDSGSNLLGIQLGIWIALMAPQWLIMLFVMLLIVGHIVGETVSITRLIHNSSILSYIDRLGRR
ncbi:hypothetical protein [Melghirimyces algeriensis]|uniref:UDP-N-acetylmuramyl pentapeptide phosphotransferase/UDP-N-acetylglucosamine-1-phosphate transferase n=1 Tax=Melghirimyces algeriensis TaxID=910412 RepID=A0A521B0F4_9BACL|nr:hypothetical protein [Melghirimyces algeriensis]SMO40587.1 hypothetical protein SAMN06264849_101449 [Melghirimyces algeriensis]